MPMPLHRRTVLQCLVAAAASAALGCRDEDEPPEEGSLYFPQSVASGDPRPDSVVLWTRAVDPARATEDTPLSLEVALDERFLQRVLELRDLSALAEHDHTLKVKVTGLQPRTRYYYRFLHERSGLRSASTTGRTRTAPAPQDEQSVRLAVANCQDFNGRYYNSWQRLADLQEELDAVVFVGDYVYEVTRAAPDGARQVRFEDPGSALVLPGGGPTQLAASSLSNYRDLYKTVRSDRQLQRVHELHPFIVVWDDHEFSNDCWGAHATYTQGLREELSVERRRHSERACNEYMPLDELEAPAGPIDVGSERLYPDTRIWRGFDLGAHARLLVTDYRTYRPDHLIPEDGYPGAVVMDEATLRAVGAAPAFASAAFAYVAIEDHPTQRQVLRRVYQQQAEQAGLSPSEAAQRAEATVRGNLALAYINPVLVQAGAPPLSPERRARGLAWVHMGKLAPFSLRGSRYVVVKDTFDVYAAWRYGVTGRASENALGAEQESWLVEQAGIGPTWKVAVSSVSPTSMVWDLRSKADVPESLRQRFYFDVDQWDGFPDKRRELLGALRARSGDRAVVVAGDIHAAFASVEQGVPALTAPAISSATVLEEIAEVVVAAGFPRGNPVFRHLVDEQEATLREGNPDIAYVNAGAHGFLVLEVRADEVQASYHLIPASEAGTDYAERPEELAAKFTRRDFVIRGGSLAPLGVPAPGPRAEGAQPGGRRGGG